MLHRAHAGAHRFADPLVAVAVAHHAAAQFAGRRRPRRGSGARRRPAGGSCSGRPARSVERVLMWSTPRAMLTCTTKAMSSGSRTPFGQCRQRREPRVGEQAVAEVGRHEQARGQHPREAEPAVLAERAQADVLVEARRARADRGRAGDQRLFGGGHRRRVHVRVDQAWEHERPADVDPAPAGGRPFAAAGALHDTAFEDDRGAVGERAARGVQQTRSGQRQRRCFAPRAVPVSAIVIVIACLRRARRAQRCRPRGRRARGQCLPPGEPTIRLHADLPDGPRARTLLQCDDPILGDGGGRREAELRVDHEQPAVGELGRRERAIGGRWEGRARRSRA